LRTLLKWALALIVIVIAAQMGRLVHSEVSDGKGHVRLGAPIPYTAILRETVHAPDGTTRIASDLTWAVRSDGSVARRLDHKRRNGRPQDQDDAVSASERRHEVLSQIDQLQNQPLETADSERVVLFASGTEVAINELAETKSTKIMRQDTNPANWQRDPRSACVNSFSGRRASSLPETVVGQEIVDGYRTVKIRANDKVTWWFALDHGCAMVKSRMDFNEREFSEKFLVGLIPGEPDSMLFHVPKNAKEVSPSERILGVNKNCVGCKPHTLDLLRKLDADYELRRVVKQE